MASKRAIVITGVSTGIGEACARVLLRAGFRVFGSVRRAADGEQLQREGGADFTPLVFDVTDAEAVQRGAATVAAALGQETLAGLVNNAGIAVAGPLEHLRIEELRRQFEVNVIAPLVVTQAFLPLLGADHARTGPPGRIVQIGSISGRIAGPFVGPYVASKHALEGLSDTLRRELMIHGIEVVMIRPGPIKTPIWEKGEANATDEFDATKYRGPLEKLRAYAKQAGETGLPAEDVGRLVHQALTVPRPKTHYAIVPQAFTNWIMPRLLPARMVDGAIGRLFGLRRQRP
ncbi:MAG: SDR family oxidoreductase [Verrucomicrobia bacterium]|nr:SDR family oxidoreductase [Verrucomicrobiota bacterium]